jgi:UDP-glucose 4-epimerase
VVPQLVSPKNLIQGELEDLSSLRKTFQAHSFSGVMHFAALASVPESMEFPLKYYRQNVGGTLNVLSIMKEFGVQKLIFSSSAAIYGDAEKIPIEEDHPQNPINPYGHSKQVVEQILAKLELQSISLRYFNAAGADPEGQIGERHATEHHLIPRILQAVKNQKNPQITIFGNQYPTPDGTCIRDYVHVSDIAKAHILALRRLEKALQPGNQVFNLGSERGFSVLEILEMVEKVTKISVNRQIGPPRVGDPPQLVASQKKICQELGWCPKFSDIRQIIQTAWNWEKRQ